MKRRFSLFTFPVMDMKAAEAELNRRAEAGWRLEKLWLGLVASFVPAEAPVCYCMDSCDPKTGDSVDYRTLLADAGWHFRSQVSYWNIYEAPAGTAPIQTDSELEYQRFRKKALRRMAIGGAALGAPVAVLFLMLGVLVALAGWAALACTLLSPLGLADWIYPPNPMEEPSRLLSAESNLLDLQREASLLVSYVEWDETHQNADGQDWDWLSGESWAVRGHWLAGRLLEQYRAEAGVPDSPPLAGYENVWYVPAAEHPEDDRFDTWLLRRGNAVLRVTCDRGLLDGGRLEDILDQLEGFQ